MNLSDKNQIIKYIQTHTIFLKIHKNVMDSLGIYVNVQRQVGRISIKLIIMIASRKEDFYSMGWSKEALYIL